MSFPAKPEFALSASAVGLIERCKRAYYIKTWMTWKGWDRDAPVAAREAYALKNANSLPQYAGHVIHTVAAKLCLAAADDWPEDTWENVAWTAANTGISTLHALCADSGTVLHPRGKSRKKFPLITEVFYGHPKFDEAKDAAIERIEVATRRLLKNQRFGLLAGKYISAEKLESIQVGDFKTWVALDLAHVAIANGERAVVIVDWKSGKPRLDSDILQMGVYGVWARRKGYPASQVSAVLSYIGLMTERVVTFTEDELDDIEQRLIDTAESVRPLVIDGDLVRFDPKPIETFEKQDKASKACLYCEYKHLCWGTK